MHEMASIYYIPVLWLFVFPNILYIEPLKSFSFN